MADSELNDLVNQPIKVKAFGREYEIKRFALGKMQRALEHIAPLGYLMRSATKADATDLLVNALAIGGAPAMGLLSVATDEPLEWLEEQDPIEGMELLSVIVEVNARYFFDSANLDRLKAAGVRIQKVIETHGGSMSTNLSAEATDTPTV